MPTNLFEQYLREQWEKGDKEKHFWHWAADLTHRELINYGNKAMEELHNGMNLEIVETE